MLTAISPRVCKIDCFYSCHLHFLFSKITKCAYIIVFEIWSHYIAQIALEIKILCLYLLSTRITDMYHTTSIIKKNYTYCLIYTHYYGRNWHELALDLIWKSLSICFLRTTK
jgi:hypothetical protein